jgi:hypothetical protein
VVDEQKMLHAIQQMKQIVMETEALNCQKFWKKTQIHVGSQEEASDNRVCCFD